MVYFISQYIQYNGFNMNKVLPEKANTCPHQMKKYLKQVQGIFKKEIKLEVILGYRYAKLINKPINI